LGEERDGFVALIEPLLVLLNPEDGLFMLRISGDIVDDKNAGPDNGCSERSIENPLLLTTKPVRMI
jgi:hypothetical protein